MEKCTERGVETRDARGACSTQLRKCLAVEGGAGRPSGIRRCTPWWPRSPSANGYTFNGRGHSTRPGTPDMGEIAHQCVNGRRQRFLALGRLIAQRLQVHPAQVRKLLHVKVAVDGGEAGSGAGERHDGGQLLEGGFLDGRGHGGSCRLAPARPPSLAARRCPFPSAAEGSLLVRQCGLRAGSETSLVAPHSIFIYII